MQYYSVSHNYSVMLLLTLQNCYLKIHRNRKAKRISEYMWIHETTGKINTQHTFFEVC